MDTIICKCGAQSYDDHVARVDAGATAHTYKPNKASSQVRKVAAAVALAGFLAAGATGCTDNATYYRAPHCKPGDQRVHDPATHASRCRHELKG